MANHDYPPYLPPKKTLVFERRCLSCGQTFTTSIRYLSYCHCCL